MSRRASTKKRTRGTVTCPPARAMPTTLQGVVSAYIRDYRDPCADELNWFAERSNLKEAIWAAAMALRPDGKRLDHQRRIPSTVLRAAATALLHRHQALARSQSFADLFAIVENATTGARGFGELGVYDTALRIGAYLRLEPEVVYLHAGTRVGARAFGVPAGQPAISPSALPSTFSRLSPREIEDCLCIFKDDIARLREPALGRSRPDA